MTPLEARLAALAASGQTVTYGALARDLGLRIGEVTEQIDALMETDAAKGKPLRAALREGRPAQGLPAQGFFLKCAALGLDLATRWPLSYHTAKDCLAR